VFIALTFVPVLTSYSVVREWCLAGLSKRYPDSELEQRTLSVSKTLGLIDLIILQPVLNVSLPDIACNTGLGTSSTIITVPAGASCELHRQINDEFYLLVSRSND